MHQDQKQLDCLFMDFYQLQQKINSFKDLLGQQKVQKIQQIIKDIQQNRKVLLNVVGNTKIGKSYFCNQLTKVFKQKQVNDIYYLETLFPSQVEEMTSGKVFYQYSNIPINYIYYQKINREDEDEQPIEEQLSYSNLCISNYIKSKQSISLLNFQLLKKIKEDHNTWRSQWQDQVKKQNKKLKMESHLSMSKLILNNVGLSKCLKICDHPGLQEQLVAQKQKANKNQSHIDRSHVSQNSISQHVIGEELIKQRVVQNPENQDEYQSDPNLQFKESQIVIYCMNHTVNNFKDYIKLLYEQNDPELIMFAFNFQRIIQAGKNKRKSILVFYKSMFHNIPEKFNKILQQMIERETNNKKTKFSQQKLQKLKKIKDQLNQYCQAKDKIFAQIISQLPRREQSMSQKIAQKVNKIAQKSQIIGKIRYTQDQIFSILKNQNTIPRLMEIYPFKLFHMFGLSGVCNDGIPFEPISQLKKMDEILKIKLVQNLKSMIKQIYNKALQNINFQIESYKQVVQDQKAKKNLSNKQRQQLRKIFPKLSSVFNKFCNNFSNLEKKVSELFIAERNLVLETINRQTNERNQNMLKTQFRFNILLQKELQKKLQIYLKNSTYQIVSQIDQIIKFWQDIAKQINVNRQIITFRMLSPHQLASTSTQFLKWSEKIKQKIQKCENQIGFTIQSSFYSFLYRKVKNLSQNLITKWNKILQYIRIVLQERGLKISIFNIKLQTYIDYGLKIKTFKQFVQVKKCSTKKADSILGLIVTPINFLLKQILSNSSDQYYKEEWEKIVQGVEKMNKNLNVLKFPAKIEQIKIQAQQKSLLKQKKEEQLTNLQNLQNGLHTIQKGILTRKSTLYSYLNEQ